MDGLRTRIDWRKLSDEIVYRALRFRPSTRRQLWNPETSTAPLLWATRRRAMVRITSLQKWVYRWRGMNYHLL